ncbi:hypothetical protein QAD02_013184 [Eretmocerus hayati]|uniref:Uncharacterized protein n=1 Tax=Eretmocerus hayati TaxID=131215 RepID=A0ACC2P4P4_9HYME|nr:hypothetical protein QAD02_013184 [Eretmocerus hayati]
MISDAIRSCVVDSCISERAQGSTPSFGEVSHHLDHEISTISDADDALVGIGTDKVSCTQNPVLLAQDSECQIYARVQQIQVQLNNVQLGNTMREEDRRILPRKGDPRVLQSDSNSENAILIDGRVEFDKFR